MSYFIKALPVALTKDFNFINNQVLLSRLKR